MSGPGPARPLGVQLGQSGVIDLRQYQELLQRIEALEKKRFPLITYRGTAQSLVGGGGFQRIAVNTVLAGEASLLSPSVGYHVPETGWYWVSGQVEISTQNTVLLIASIFRNGLEELRGERLVPTFGPELWAVLATGLVFANAGETLELWCDIGGSEARALDITSVSNRLQVYKVT